MCPLAYSRSKSTSSNPYETLQRSPEFYHSQLGVKLVLKMAGIDTSLYKAHCCRSASTYWVYLLKIYWKEVNGRGHQLGKDIIIRKSWIQGRVLSLKLLFSTTLWTKVMWMYGFQYGRDWSQLSNIRSPKFYEVKLRNCLGPRSSRKVILILWSKIKYDLILYLPLHP